MVAPSGANQPASGLRTRGCSPDIIRIAICHLKSDLHATHFGINLAVDAIWNLTEQLRYLLHLHCEGQRAFAQKATDSGPAATQPERVIRRPAGA